MASTGVEGDLEDCATNFLGMVASDDNSTDSDSDDEAGYDDRRVRMAFTEELPDIEVQAHIEYEERFAHFVGSSKKHFIYSDGGADSCVAGKGCHMESFTNRHANLVGYDPGKTRSKRLQIGTALIKVKSREGVPCLLRAHESVFNPDCEISLLSEYQVQEYGKVVDSVAKKHKTAQDTYGYRELGRVLP